MSTLFIFIGLAFLVLGGEFVIRGAIRLARHYRVSPLAAGITVVGFGTSLPELAVCIDAALEGSTGLAIGNVIGSNIANTLLILGIAAAICPVIVNPRSLRFDNAAHLCAALFFVGSGFLFGQLQWQHGFVLVAGMTAYVVITFRRPESAEDAELALQRDDWPHTDKPPAALALLVAGLASVLIGAEFLVEGAVRLAGQIGVSDEVIGLTVTAVGTSLPEIAATIAAAWRRQTQMCLGNIIGSNLFNITGITGATAIVAPLEFSAKITTVELPVLLAVSVMLTAVMLAGRRINRLPGIALVAAYTVFVGAQFAAAH